MERFLESRIIKNGGVAKLLPILAAFLGFLPVPNPFRNVQKLQFSFISVFTIISLFQLVYPILYISYVLKVLSSASAQLKLTEKFIHFTLAPAACFSGAVTRLDAILNCGKTIKLMRVAMDMKRQMSLAGFQRQRSKWTKWFFLFACTSWVLVFPTRVMVNVMTDSASDEAYAYSAWFQTLALIATFSIETAPAYALAFTLIGGVYLLDLQDVLGQLLCTELQGAVHYDSVLTVATANGGNNAGDMKNGSNREKPRFFDQFKILKNLFSVYEDIAGWYVLSLLVVSVAGLTQAVCVTVFQRTNFSDNNVGGLAESGCAIMLLAFFGEFVKNEVSCPFSVSL